MVHAREEKQDKSLYIGGKIVRTQACSTCKKEVGKLRICTICEKWMHKNVSEFQEVFKSNALHARNASVCWIKIWTNE